MLTECNGNINLVRSCNSFVFFHFNIFALWELTGVAIVDTLGSESSVANILVSTLGLSNSLKRAKYMFHSSASNLRWIHEIYVYLRWYIHFSAVFSWCCDRSVYFFHQVKTWSMKIIKTSNETVYDSEWTLEAWVSRSMKSSCLLSCSGWSVCFMECRSMSSKM